MQDLVPVISVAEDGGRNRTNLVAKDGVERVDNVDLGDSQAATAQVPDGLTKGKDAEPGQSSGNTPLQLGTDGAKQLDRVNAFYAAVEAVL